MTIEMRLAVDTNVLVYAEGEGDSRRCAQANDLMQRLSAARIVLPVQVCGELFRVLHRKYGHSAALASAAIERWAALHAVADTTWTAMQAGFELVGAHGCTVWDALILAVAAEHRCAVLLSEDMQHGFTWRGVCVVNPFVEPTHPRLAALLA